MPNRDTFRMLVFISSSSRGRHPAHMGVLLQRGRDQRDQGPASCLDDGHVVCVAADSNQPSVPSEAQPRGSATPTSRELLKTGSSSGAKTPTVCEWGRFPTHTPSPNHGRSSDPDASRWRDVRSCGSDPFQDPQRKAVGEPGSRRAGQAPRATRRLRLGRPWRGSCH